MDSILNYKVDQKENYYDLLGCDELSSVDQILREFKLLSLKNHPDKNESDPTAVQKFQKLLKAKEILCDPEKRLVYDKWRRSCLSMPFEQFVNLNKNCHTSIHWASKKQKDFMLEPCGASTEPCETPANQPELCDKTVWVRETGNELLSRFRNYEV